jgi:hypothetical protein
VRYFIGYRPEPPADYIERGVAAPPDEPQYEGVVFTDGSVALRWRTEYKSTSVWTCYQDFYHVHGHPEYGTRIEWLDDPVPETQRKHFEVLQRDVAHYQRTLAPLCPCDPNPSTTDGPQRECPLHGDGITFVGEYRALQNENIELRRELEARRASVTTGGLPAPFTEGWERGDSSRPPTAPPEPEELVVALPVSDEQAAELPEYVCEDCGQPHPAWISCEAERRTKS